METKLPSVTPFLMFEGQAEAAMSFYTSLFPQSETVSLTRYGPNEAGTEGSVMMAIFSLNGQKIMCIDSNVSHGFTFTPAMSLYVNCQSEAEVERLFEALSADGAIMMPLQSYPFSEKFAWVADRFGVSWQINLARGA